LLVAAAGCSASKGDEEERVREAFSAFQSAVNDRDGDKLWALLDKDSQGQAERAARTLRENHGRADAAGKEKQAKILDVPSDQMASLTGAGFLKTQVFYQKYHEVPGSTITRVAIEGDRATVYYREADGDNEQFSLTRGPDGRWRASVAMPVLPQS
jgi:hypothetical protein